MIAVIEKVAWRSETFPLDRDLWSFCDQLIGRELKEPKSSLRAAERLGLGLAH